MVVGQLLSLSDWLVADAFIRRILHRPVQFSRLTGCSEVFPSHYSALVARSSLCFSLLPRRLQAAHPRRRQPPWSAAGRGRRLLGGVGPGVGRGRCRPLAGVTGGGRVMGGLQASGGLT
jgi:hypothetical protein